MMKIKALCGHKILQHETIHNTMSHVNMRQDVFQNRREKCLLTNLDIRGVAEADN